MENKMRRHLSRRLTLLERATKAAFLEDPTLSTLSPHIDYHGKICFPTDDEQQTEDYREIEATDVALDLARDFIATTERRGLWGDGSWTAPARQAVDLLAEYVIWRLNNRNGSSPPAKFTGNDDG
jgi:hypothetical protein